MARSVNDIFFRFKADTKGLDRGTKKASKSLGGVGSAAKRMGGILAGAFAAREIISFGKNAINAASDYTESVNALEVATGSASKEILKLGETSASALGISGTSLNEAAVAFAGFAEQINAGDVSGTFEELITRASDFASVYNLEVDEALQVFQSTLAGQSKPIRAYGKDLSAASVKAFALANGIGDASGELSEGEKVQARYGLLLQETSNTAGDFANTSGELAGQQRILNAEWDDAVGLIGKQLLPMMNSLTGLMLDALDASEDFTGGVLLGTRGLEKFFSRAVDLINLGFSDVWTDADEASFKFSKTLQFTRDRLEEGADAARLAVSWIADLADKTAITASTYEDMGSVLGLSEVQMRQATQEVISLAGSLGLSADQVQALKDRIIGLNPLLLTTRDIFPQYGSAAGDAAGQVRDLKDATGDLQDELDVFDAGNAIQAMRDFITLNDLRFGRLPSTGGIGGRHPGDILGLAHGGTIQPGGVALVGEQGPEIIQPRGGARITPLNKGKVGGGSVTVNVNFNGVVGDPVEAAQMIIDLIETHGRTNAV